jgi:ribosomal protein L31/acyl carrier protein
VIKIKKRSLVKDLRSIFLLLLISTLLLATQKTLLVKSDSVQFDSIRNSDWYWTDTEVLSTVSTQTSDWPEIVTDSVGNLHVVWHDQTNYLSSGTDRDIFYQRWEVSSSSWTTTEVISEGDFQSMFPDIAVDSANNVHVVWEENSQVILYKKWTASTQSWSIISTISTESLAVTTNPAIEIDSSSNIHVVWHDESDILSADTDADVFYKIWNETKQAWSSSQVVSTESDDQSYIPELAIDSLGNVHVVWNDLSTYSGSGIDYDIFYKYLDATTKIWQPAVVISNISADFSLNPDIAVDSLDNVHIVWEENEPFDGAEMDSDIFYIMYNKDLSSWTSPESISDVVNQASWMPSIDIDFDDNVHVAWEDATDMNGADTELDIFYRMFSSNRDTWSRIDVISTDSTTSARFASVAVGRYGSLNIVWKDITNITVSGSDYDIHFKRLIGPPAEPTLAPIVPDKIGIDTLQLSWNDVKGVRKYYVYRDTEFIWSVDHLDPIFTLSANSTIDTLPATGIYGYVVVADNVHYNSSPSNCIYVEYAIAHVREFVISISMITIIAMLVITMRIRRKRYKT